MNLAEFLKDTSCKLTQFKPAQMACLAREGALARYCALVDVWDAYDNSGPTPVLISEGNL